MRIEMRALSTAAIAMTTLMATRADAHLITDRRATVHVVDQAVFSVISVPSSTLAAFDDDHDGMLSARELDLHQAAMRDAVDARFAIMDGDVKARTVRVDLILSPDHEGVQDRAGHLVALKHVTFATAPHDLRVTSDLFEDADRSIAITATAKRDGVDVEEVFALTPSSNTHRFFQSGSSQPPATNVEAPHHPWMIWIAMAIVTILATIKVSALHRRNERAIT